MTEIELDNGWHRYLRTSRKKGTVIIADEQLWGELLAYAGMPPSDDSPGLIPWIQDVLKAISEIHPESNSSSRLNMMADFSEYCKERRK